jgi:DNA-binding XRE family transcriptional regulator
MRIRSAAENEWVVKMSVYQRLKDVRQDADKSQEEIAKIIGTSQSYYAQYENGCISCIEYIAGDTIVCKNIYYYSDIIFYANE